jgi:ADP-ribose pyrophosphatase
MIKEWELIDRQVDRDYKVFQIARRLSRSPRTNRIGTFYTIHGSDWVNVIPITADNQVVMIRQYRHGSEDVTLEIPGGLIEETNPEAAALRELLEETGYTGEKVRYLGATNPNPAIFDNLCHTFLVEGASKVADSSLDPDEDIDVVLVPLSDVPSLIRDGTITHALVVVAFHFLDLNHS